MNLRVRTKTLLYLTFITVLGFGFKYYPGPGHYWFNNYIAGVFYEIFWCLAIFLVFPKRENAFKIALLVFIITSLLEFLQLYNPPIIQAVRSTFVGRTLIGTTFSWWDFLYYGVGCVGGYIMVIKITPQHN